MKKLFLAALLTVAFSAQAQWATVTTKDAMTDAVTRTAWQLSPTVMRLKFPYEGATAVRLYVRRDRIWLASNDGQILASEGIVFRFDDEPPVTVEAVGTASGSSKQVYVADDELADELASRIVAAKRLRVRVVFFENGERVLEFSPKGLKLAEKPAG